MSENEKPVPTFQVTAHSWADGHRAIRETEGPIKWRIGSMSQPGWLWQLKSCDVWVAFYQPNPTRTNFTRMAILFSKRPSASFPKGLDLPGVRELPWIRRRIHRKGGKRSAALQLRMGKPELKLLPRPVPVGVWQGLAAFDNADLDLSTACLVEFEAETNREALITTPAGPRVVVPAPTTEPAPAPKSELPKIILP